jgi:hypothetical protein
MFSSFNTLSVCHNANRFFLGNKPKSTSKPKPAQLVPSEKFGPARTLSRFAMNERIQFIDHQGKQVLLIDLSHCPARQVEQIARCVPDYVTVKPRASVLILTDFTGPPWTARQSARLKKLRYSINRSSRNPHSSAPKLSLPDFMKS